MDEAGFDAVVGNPPYVRIQGETEQYLRDAYHSPHYFVDLFHVFIEEGINIVSQDGEFGFIVPEPWLTQENTEQLREFVLNNAWMRKITQFGKKVFDEATVDTIILLLEDSQPKDVDIIKAENQCGELTNLNKVNSVPQQRFERSPEKRIEIRQTGEEQRLLDKINSNCAVIRNIAEVSIGIQAYNSSEHSKETIESRSFHADHKKSDDYYPEVSGQDVSRYQVRHDGETWVKYGDHLHDYRPMRFFEEPRVLVREITDSGRYRIHAGYTDEAMCNYKTVLNLLPDEDYSPGYLLAILNSSLLSWIFPRTSNKVISDTFPRISVSDIKKLPIPEISFSNGGTETVLSDSNLEQVLGTLENPESSIDIGTESGLERIHALLSELAMKRTDYTEEMDSFNLDLFDHLGTYSDGPTLAAVSFTQPAEGVAESVLSETTEEKPNLRVGRATVERESEHTVTVRLTARYKPTAGADDAGGATDGEAVETDRWGYTETEPLPALRVTDLTATEADLIEAFVPRAVDKAGGFADFRETATKTNSLVDRLRGMTLPEPVDVTEGVASYRRTKERAADLDEKIERTDDLIDEIVYELYGLTDEEIEIVEEAVGE